MKSRLLKYPSLNIFFDQNEVRWSRKTDKNERVVISFYFSLDDLENRVENKISSIIEGLLDKKNSFMILPIPKCKIGFFYYWKRRKFFSKERSLFLVDGNDFRFAFKEEVENMKDCFQLHEKCQRCFWKLLGACKGINYFKDKYKQKKEDEWLQKNSELCNKKIKFLDLGCGVSPFVELYSYLAKNNDSEFFCVDPSSAYIENLDRKIKPDLKNKIFTRVDSGENFIFTEKYFDYVLLHNSYSHLVSVDKTFEKINHYIKSGGAVIIFDNFEFFKSTDKGLFEKSIDDNFFDRREYRNHSLDKIEKMLLKHGYGIQDKFQGKINQMFSWGIKAIKK